MKSAHACLHAQSIFFFTHIDPLKAVQFGENGTMGVCISKKLRIMTSGSGIKMLCDCTSPSAIDALEWSRVYNHEKKAQALPIMDAVHAEKYWSVTHITFSVIFKGTSPQITRAIAHLAHRPNQTHMTRLKTAEGKQTATGPTPMYFRPAGSAEVVENIVFARINVQDAQPDASVV